MYDNERREKVWGEELRLGLLDADNIRRKARQAAKDKQFVLAGTLFAAIGLAAQEDPDSALNAARNYEKGQALDDAQRWYLTAAERFAQYGYPTKAIATLRLYHKLAPEEFEGPRRIFKLSRSSDDLREQLLEFLSPKDKAGQHLRSKEVFAAFDDATFDDMLDGMQLQSLQAGDVLVRKDEPAASLFIVIDGRLDGYLPVDGERTLIGSIYPGGICGEIGYFLGGRRTAEVVVGESGSVLELSYEKLDELADKVPAFGKRLDELYHSRMLANHLTCMEFFSGLSADLRNEIARRMRPMRVHAGTHLFTENETSKDLYLILSGEVAVHLALGSGKHLKDVSDGCVVGEFSVSLGGKRTASIQALTNCKLMRLSGDDYQQLYDSHQELRDLLAKRKQTHIAETRDFILGMDEGISERICTAMLRMIWGPGEP